MAKVSDLIAIKDNLDTISTTLTTPIVNASQVMAESRIGVLVCRDEQGSIEGIISERDIVRAVAEQPQEIHKLLVSDVATRDVLTCRMSDTLERVTQKMKQKHCRHMPVLTGKMLVGLISTTDIFRYYVEYSPQDVAQISDFYKSNDY
jgi:CBS domain-containing protein